MIVNSGTLYQTFIRRNGDEIAEYITKNRISPIIVMLLRTI